MKQSAIIVPDGCTTVLLHSCCAPCSGAILEWLMAHGIEPVVYYCNPNIYPLEEYEKRKEEIKHHAQRLGVTFIEEPYDHQSWLRDICGLENEPERGKRCEACFALRLKKAARKAQELGINYFATTLASSRWKNLDQVNAAGLSAQQMENGKWEMGNLQFWSQNWRKDGLQERRNQIIKENNFYNQTYCGCEFSLKSNTDTGIDKLCTNAVCLKA